MRDSEGEEKEMKDYTKGSGQLKYERRGLSFRLSIEGDEEET